MYTGKTEVYKLICNDGEFFVTGHPTSEQIMTYYTHKRKLGMSITDIFLRVIPYQTPSARSVINTLIAH